MQKVTSEARTELCLTPHSDGRTAGATEPEKVTNTNVKTETKLKLVMINYLLNIFRMFFEYAGVRGDLPTHTISILFTDLTF